MNLLWKSLMLAGSDREISDRTRGLVSLQYAHFISDGAFADSNIWDLGVRASIAAVTFEKCSRDIENRCGPLGAYQPLIVVH
jgi:hypothetical protein